MPGNNCECDDNVSNMMEKRTDRLTPQHRRLPTVPHIFKPQRSPLTIYRDAGERMSERQQTTNRTTELNKQNSKPLKRRSRERIHDIDSRLSFKDSSGMKRDVNNLKPKTDICQDDDEVDKTHSTDTDIDDNLVFVPEILISHVENDEDCIQWNKPIHVFVCGHVDNGLWHRMLVDLCREFSVRCTSPSDYPECNRWLPKTDVFVFLIDEISARASPYKDQLRLAIMLDLNIVYVRDLGFELTKGENGKPVSHGNLETENNVEHLNSESNSNNLLHPNILGKSPVKLLLNSTVVSTETREEAPALHVNSFGHIHSVGEAHDTCGRREVDINKIIEIEYGTALVYHDLYHTKCIERIVSSINRNGSNLKSGATSLSHSRQSIMSEAMSLAHSRQSMTSEAVSLAHSRNSLNTPAFSIYSNVSNDSALGDMFHRMTPEPNVPEAGEHLLFERSKSLDEPSFPSGLSSPTETIYLVAPNTSSEKPKVFHWPADVEKDIVNSPSIDSFGFQDIDLSKRVNEIDLFEENLSD
ncbi:uncharacterized protein LOC128555287 isoform X2 [Mercenaria mercenaria]|uniref:uncharacterized protein LOC128555287 isoform X2 n=1 Tax=Mercenaria mercenaria TaxID=6596 RepID=UPI00234F9F43|nr:uncharacterized protein LOC128555287 isoform X2 [Mercenaria mercenaria]